MTRMSFLQRACTDVHKSPLSSRKFVAYMFGDICWTILIFGGLYRLEQMMSSPTGIAISQNVGMVSLLMVMVIVKGFMQAGYIGSQAWLDKYVRVAQIAAGQGEQTVTPANGPASGDIGD